jgi:hypothetical protein
LSYLLLLVPLKSLSELPNLSTISQTHDMSPPSATGATMPTWDRDEPGTATHEPDLTKAQAVMTMSKFPGPPTFDDPYKEREYLKGRLALAFRIFAKFGFDEGVAGHITLRVRTGFLAPRFILTQSIGSSGTNFLLGEPIRSRMASTQSIRPNSR